MLDECGVRLRYQSFYKLYIEANLGDSSRTDEVAKSPALWISKGVI